MSAAIVLALVGPFAGVDQAASAGLTAAAICSHQVRECGGMIFNLGGKYYFTTPISGQAFSVNLWDAYEAIPGQTPVADFHIHICSPYNWQFSPFFSKSDTLVNQGLHTVGYMASLCDGNIHRYDPTQDDADDIEVDFHNGLVIYLTSGHISGWIDLRRVRP